MLLLVTARDARSQQPSGGDTKQECIAASEQGQSERDEGRYRAARKAFFSCTRAVCPRVIVDSCTKWLSDLDNSAPTIVLGATDERGNDLTDVTVTFDGTPLATLLDGKPIEVDAGEHLVHFERSGVEPIQQRLVLRAGEKARGVTVILRSSGVLSVAPTSAEAFEARGRPAPVTTVPEPLFSSRHVVAATLGLGAVAAAGVAVYFVAQSDHDRGVAANLRTDLPSNACTHAPSLACQTLGDTVSSQHRESSLAAALFAGAGVLGAGAIVSWLLWPQKNTPSRPASAWMTPIHGGAAAGLGGSFR